MASVSLSDFYSGGGGGSSAGAILSKPSNQPGITAAADVEWQADQTWGGVTFDAGTDIVTLPQGERFILISNVRCFDMVGASAEIVFGFVDESDVAYGLNEGIQETTDATHGGPGAVIASIDTTSASEQVKVRITSVSGTSVSVDKEGSFWVIFSV